jgi:hypothetical protein
MACLEQLQQDVSDILDTLRKMDPCCDGGDPTDGDQYTDPVTDGEGDVPQPIIDAGYADDAADWAGFDDYKCMVAHVVVDSMEAKIRKIALLVDDIGWVTGGMVALAAIVSVIWTGGLTFIVGGLIMSVGAVAYLYDAMVSGSGLLTLADDIQSNHDELACAFYLSEGSQDSVDNLKAEIDEIFTPAAALLLKNTGLAVDAKALYAGRYNQIDTAAALADLGYDVEDFDCVCGEDWEEELQHDFLEEKPDWLGGGAYWVGGMGNPAGCLRMLVNNGVIMDAATLMEEKGYTVEPGDLVYIIRLRFDHWRAPAVSTFKLYKDVGEGSFLLWEDTQEREVWHTYDVQYGIPIELDPNEGHNMFTLCTHGGPQYSQEDNIYIYFTVVKA